MWIEIYPPSFLASLHSLSRPARALWIEIDGNTIKMAYAESRPARALWIEISPHSQPLRINRVEAREGLVD